MFILFACRLSLVAFCLCRLQMAVHQTTYFLGATVIPDQMTKATANAMANAQYNQLKHRNPNVGAYESPFDFEVKIPQDALTGKDAIFWHILIKRQNRFAITMQNRPYNPATGRLKPLVKDKTSPLRNVYRPETDGTSIEAHAEAWQQPEPHTTHKRHEMDTTFDHIDSKSKHYAFSPSLPSIQEQEHEQEEDVDVFSYFHDLDASVMLAGLYAGLEETGCEDAVELA